MVSSNSPQGKGRLAHFVSAFPVLSETFVYDEIQAFAKAGFENVIVSLRPPPKGISGEDEKRILGGRDLRIIETLDTPLAPLAGFRAFFRRPGVFTRVKTSLVAAALRTPTEAPQLFWTLQRACEAAPDLARLGVAHCHAHFAHYPASLAWACSRLVGTTFSFNAHGYDLYRYRAHLARKIRDADRIFPISNKNRDFLFEKGGKTSDLERRLVLSRCGIDLTDYAYRARPEKLRENPLVVSVGRLVDIKGFSDLVEAARLLAEAGKPVRVEIVGEGPDRESLERQIAKAGLADRVRLLGALSRTATRAKQNEADLIVQPSRPGHHGPEGIPMVLMEAMALGVPVLSTRFAAIPELVEEGATGFLVEPGIPRQIAAELARLLDNGIPPSISVAARARIESLHDGPANYYKKVAAIDSVLASP